GLIMETGKRYTQTVERAFHVSMACLDPTTADNDNVSVLLSFDNREFILCSLNKHRVIQTQLDLNFQSGDKIAFMSSGRGRVHLTGYLLETDDDDDDEDDVDDDLTNNEDSMIDSESFGKKESNSQLKGSGKRKNEPHLSKSENKKAKLAEAESDEDELSSDGDDFNFAGGSEDSEDDDDDDEEEEDDEDDDDDVDDDSEDVEIETSPKQRTPESRKKDKQMIKTPTDILQSKLAAERMKTPNEQQGKNKSLIGKQRQNRTPKEKQQQKDRTTNEKQQQKNKTPSEKQQQKNKTPSEKQQQGGTPKPSPGTQVNGIPVQQQSGKKNKKGQETPKGPKTPGADTPQKKVLEGGVTIEEVKVGNGPVAKPGREVSVYFVGRLKHNNKQFDSATQGSGFKFRLGRGEVIKGWDIGVSGMKVGGKRRIICPPALAYGSKGSPPAIPSNSTLVFDIELKTVN
ncbi:hypothetical protein B7P43_G19110, partial [Cryptotermes secundus]